MTATPPERRHRGASSRNGAAEPPRYDPQFALDWFRRARARTRELFDMLEREAYFARPIPLRNPIVFYEGHFAAFAVNVLLKRALGQEGINSDYEVLFERGIDPDSIDEVDDEKDEKDQWPSRDEILRYAAEADRRIEKALVTEDLDRPGDPYLDGAAAVWTVLEHEAMHHETLLYMFHRLGFSAKRRPEDLEDLSRCTEPPEQRRVTVPAGIAHLGQTPGLWGWDNEFDPHVVEVDAFECDVYAVTNRDFARFLDDGGYDDRRWWTDESWNWKSDELIRSPLFWEKHNGEWFWRGQFELIPLPASWPVWVTLYEAEAFARWSGRRIMTEPEYHRAAFGDPSGVPREHPWGNEAPRPDLANIGFQRWDPAPVDGHPLGASAWGIEGLVGNGWEWTSTEFAPFPGFEPDPNYPQYSADFFDGKHFVIKGGSPVTAPELLRRSFRNWFRPNYPYVYAKFRTVG